MHRENIMRLMALPVLSYLRSIQSSVTNSFVLCHKAPQVSTTIYATKEQGKTCLPFHFMWPAHKNIQQEEVI